MHDRTCDSYLVHLVYWQGKRVPVQADAIGHLSGRQHPQDVVPPNICAEPTV